MHHRYDHVKGSVFVAAAQLLAVLSAAAGDGVVDVVAVVVVVVVVAVALASAVVSNVVAAAGKQLAFSGWLLGVDLKFLRRCFWVADTGLFVFVLCICDW